MLNIIRLSIIPKRRTCPSTSLRSISSYSALTQKQQEKPKQSSESDIVVHDAKFLRKAVKLEKKILETPFMKSCFLGRFNPSMLIYPQIDQERLDHVTDYIRKVEPYLRDKVNTNQIDDNNHIPKNVKQDLASLDLFGLKVPIEYGGLEYPESESSFIYEACAYDFNISNLITCTQELAVTAISEFGNSIQKSTFLPKIASGLCSVCFCYLEDHSEDSSIHMKTIAYPSEDNETLTIEGVKTWISHIDRPDLFIVFAATFLNDEKRTPSVTAFLVDSQLPGIEVSEPYEKLGMRGVPIGHIKFNVKVKKSDVLGQFNCGMDIIKRVVQNGKLNLGPESSGAMKKLIHEVIQHSICTKHNGINITNYECVQGLVGKMVMDTYAVESMTYLYAGLLDNYEKPDVTLESIIMKVATSEALNRVVRNSMELIGHNAYLKGTYVEKINRDAQFYLISDDKNDYLKLMLGFMGVMYAGEHRKEFVRENRNPLTNPSYYLRRLFPQQKWLSDYPNLTHELAEELHPSLKDAADSLEYCVLRLAYATEMTLISHGTLISDKHLKVLRLAEIAIDIFALAAVLGRASRAYCIGLRNCDIDIDIAVVLAALTLEKTRNSVWEIIDIYSSDCALASVGKKTLNSKRYPLEHPLSRNY